MPNKAEISLLFLFRKLGSQWLPLTHLNLNSYDPVLLEEKLGAKYFQLICSNSGNEMRCSCSEHILLDCKEVRKIFDPNFFAIRQLGQSGQELT